MIRTGVVSSLEDGRARIAQIGDDWYITAPLFIPPYIGELRVGQRVAYVEFMDQSGAIVCVMEV